MQHNTSRAIARSAVHSRQIPIRFFLHFFCGPDTACARLARPRFGPGLNGVGSGDGVLLWFSSTNLRAIRISCFASIPILQHVLLGKGIACNLEPVLVFFFSLFSS